MRWLSSLFWGSLAGLAAMMGLYGLVLAGLMIQTGGAGDPVSSALIASHPDLIKRTVFKFFLLHLLVGTALGMASGMLTELTVAPGKNRLSATMRFFCHLLACAAVFLYLNVRFLVLKPMFYAPLLNARGGPARWLQNTLTGNLSPAGVDLLFIALLVLAFVVFKRTRIKSGFRKFPAAGALLFFPLLLLLGLSGAADAPKKPPAAFAEQTEENGSFTPSSGLPNILFLGSDSLRPDHLSCCGYNRKTSPNIDVLASKAVRFEQAYVPLARTLPSWVSLLTSTYPHTHGFRHMFPSREKRRIHLPLLTRILSSAGYGSAVVSDYAGECFDMVDMGFDSKDVPTATSIQVIIERFFLQKQPYLVPFLDNDAGHRLLPLLSFLMINPDPDRMTNRVINAMRSINASGRPFFINAFFSCTHIPYALPHPYYEMFTDPEYKGIHKYGFGIGDPREIEKTMQRPPQRDQDHIIDLYDGGVAAFDHAAGGIFRELDRMGVMENTIILILSDHGENLYDSGNLLEHGERFGGGDAANRCPLILYDPEERSGPLSIETPVHILDVMPTLLARLGLPVPSTVRGEDLSPLMRKKTVKPRVLFAETGLSLNGTPDTFAGSGLEYPDILSSLDADPVDGTLFLRKRFERSAIAAKERQVRTERYKLIYVPTPEGAEFSLYDVTKDPANENNLYGTKNHVAIGEALKRRLFEFILEEPGSGLDRKLHLIQRYTFLE